MSAWDAYNKQYQVDDVKFEDDSSNDRDFNDSHMDANMDNWKGVFLDYGAEGEKMECEAPAPAPPPAPTQGNLVRDQQPTGLQQFIQHQHRQQPQHNFHNHHQGDSQMHTGMLDFDLIGDNVGYPQNSPLPISRSKLASESSKLEKKCTEKQRREKLSEQFQELAKALGLGENHKNNRVEILQTTIKTLNRVNAEKQEITNERDQLRLQLSYCHGVQMAPKMGPGGNFNPNLYPMGLGNPFINSPMPMPGMHGRNDLNMLGQGMPGSVFGQAKMPGNSVLIPKPI